MDGRIDGHALMPVSVERNLSMSVPSSVQGMPAVRSGLVTE